ncbi:hypothetical protein, partial [Streptomyces alkaliterrae]|uniref:hypothetical protein n=1 Tax=Streptomyces alkaliterrae TaxID=2213162 RepID=UPI001E527E8C
MPSRIPEELDYEFHGRNAKVVNTEGKRPEEARKGIRRKRPFLENSTVCQKSTPDMLIPRPFTFVDGRGSFETQHSEDAVNEWAYSACLFRSSVVVTPITGKHSW